MKNNGHEYDIDPADFEARVAIRKTLKIARLTAEITQSELSARYGQSPESQSLFERSTSWHVGRVQQIARRLGLTFWMIPLGLPDKVAGDATSTVYRASRVKTVEDWDYLHRSWTRWYLAAARLEMGIASVEMARRLNVDRRAIWDWEHADADPYLHYMQRYARVMGGSLTLHLIPSKPLNEEADPCIGETT